MLLLSTSARQPLSYGDCLEVKREYYQNSSVLDCVTQCLQSAAHLYEQFLQVKQIEFVTLVPSGFLQCFETVGLVIWPVKIIPEMTCYVSSGTLNATHSFTHWVSKLAEQPSSTKLCEMLGPKLNLIKLVGHLANPSVKL